MRFRLTAAALGLSLTLALAGCGGPARPTSPGSPAAEARTVTVFAAASLEATFTELGEAFEASHEGVTVAINFAGSQTLAEQIVQGAPADVFAAANEATMDTVMNSGLVSGEPRLFATNRLVIAVPPDNPAGIASFGDIAEAGLKLVVCAPAVPCGAATAKVAQAAALTLTPVSEEQAVTDVLAKVRAGEADAGLVYQTDVRAAGDTVTGIDFPESARAINSNPIVALKDGPQAGLGEQFVDLVLSPEGQKVLADAGFGAAG